jgi:hypothetical protein
MTRLFLKATGAIFTIGFATLSRRDGRIAPSFSTPTPNKFFNVSLKNKGRLFNRPKNVTNPITFFL